VSFIQLYYMHFAMLMKRYTVVGEIIFFNILVSDSLLGSDFFQTALKRVYMNCRLCSELYHRVKKFCCQFSSCFLLRKKFGIICLCGLGNTGRK